MSGVTENKWNFDPLEYEQKEGVVVHANMIYEKLISQEWWNDSMDVVDFGCGVGLLSRLFASNRKISTIECVDVEEKMVNISKQRAEEQKLSAMMKFRHLTKLDASELGDAIADCIYTVTVLGHVRDVDIPIVFSNLAKALKPQGRIVIAEFNNINNLPSHDHKSGDKAEGHSHSHGHSHGHGHGHSHGHDHEHGQEHSHESAHVSDGGHYHTDLNEEILRNLSSSNDLEVESVTQYTIDMEDSWGEGFKEVPMIFFVAKHS